MMRIAVEGCGHGTLHAIYASVKQSCKINNWNGVDLLIVGGDFQAVRNTTDLNSMEVPLKYRELGDFHEYYSGTRTAPYLTLFVGGNHEASSHLHELFYGGWVAPKIYYLGAANVVRFGDLRIAGMSGIWKGYSYNKAHFERVPYTPSEIRSVYHIREMDVRKLLLLREQVDVGISHDWPRAVEWCGNHKQLFRFKSHFEADSQAGTLGSAAAKYVMDRLRPPYWFSAHMHAKFTAIVDFDKDPSNRAPHESSASSNPNEVPLNGTRHGDRMDQTLNGNNSPAANADPPEPVKNTDEIDLDMDSDSSNGPPQANLVPTLAPPEPAPIQAPSTGSSVPDSIRAQLPASFSRPSMQPTSVHNRSVQSSLPPPPGITNKITNFLALDKVLPNRKFLQLLNIDPLSESDPPAPLELSYDPEWLSILRVFGSHDPQTPSPPNLGETHYQPLIAQERQWVDETLKDRLDIPENFEVTAPVYDGSNIKDLGQRAEDQPKEYTNPQTQAFCNLIGIKNHFHDSEDERVRFRERKVAIVEAERAAEQESGRGRGRGRGGGRGGRDRGRGRGRGRGR